jgi:hypothetical protein
VVVLVMTMMLAMLSMMMFLWIGNDDGLVLIIDGGVVHIDGDVINRDIGGMRGRLSGRSRRLSGRSRRLSGRSRRLSGHRLRTWGNNGSITRLEVRKVFTSFEVHRLKVTSVQSRVSTSFQIHIEELSSGEVVVNFTSIKVVLCVTTKGGSKRRSTEEGDSEKSDFDRVLHVVLVMRCLEKQV